MADICCDQIVGGLVYITLKGKTYHATGDVVIRPLPVSRSHGVSSGGRFWMVEKGEAAEADITFLDYCDADPDDIFNARCHVDITVVEKSRDIRHMFTRSGILGRAEKNLSNGEYGGLMIGTDNYSKVDRTGQALAA